MLHNQGSLGLMSAYQEEYTRMLEVSVECGFDLIETERDLFEIDHCAAGALLAEEWNFPDVIVKAIATHHQEPSQASSLASLVRVGWRLADVLGFAVFPPDKPWTYEELLAFIPGGSGTWLAGAIEDVKSEVDARLSVFSL